MTQVQAAQGRAEKGLRGEAMELNREEREQLVTLHRARAMAYAKRWGRERPALRDEFESEANFTLWKEALEYDPACGHEFGAVLFLRLKFNFLHTVHKFYPKGYRGRKVSLRPAIISLETGFDDDVKDNSMKTSDLTNSEYLETLLAKLPERLARIVRLVFIDFAGANDPQEQAAKVLGCTSSNICNRLKTAMRLMREHAQVVSASGLIPVREPEVTPCLLCSTREGYRSKPTRRPLRYNAARFGLEGYLCATCYEFKKYQAKHPERKRNMARRVLVSGAKNRSNT